MSDLLRKLAALEARVAELEAALRATPIHVGFVSPSSIVLGVLTQDLQRNGKATSTLYPASSSTSSGGKGTAFPGSADVFDADMIPIGKKIASGATYWGVRYTGKIHGIQFSACPVNV